MTNLFPLCRPIRLGCLGLCLAATWGSFGCSHAKLDDTFGMRNRDIFRVQTSARNSREVMAHGQEVESAVAKLYQSMAPDDGGKSKASTSGGGGLKIPSLH